LTTGLQLAKKLRPAGRPPARRHHLVSPGDIISESAGDFVGICTQADSPNVNAAITQGTTRVIIALPHAVNRVEPTNDNGYIAPFLSMNPAVGLENLLAEPVRGDLVETAKTPSASNMAHQRASESVEKPSSVERKLATIFCRRCRRLQPTDGVSFAGSRLTGDNRDRLTASHRGRIFNRAGDGSW
jgi:hypothetical protein